MMVIPPAMRAMYERQLIDANEALSKLVTGRLEQIVLYNGGEGSRSVTFTRTSIEQLKGHIAELEHKLGIRARRAIGVRF